MFDLVRLTKGNIFSLREALAHKPFFQSEETPVAQALEARSNSLKLGPDI